MIKISQCFFPWWPIWQLVIIDFDNGPVYWHIYYMHHLVSMKTLTIKSFIYHMCWCDNWEIDYIDSGYEACI